MRKALLLSAGYSAAALLLLPAAWDPVAVMNAVIAERGGFTAFELVHPLYTPLLALLSKALSAAGVHFPYMAFFQGFSALAAGASAGLLFLLLAACGLSSGAAAAGALCAAFSGGFWYWAAQAKPYAPALFFSLLSFYLLAVPGAGPGRKRLLAAAAAFAAACGFTLACLALLPALWYARGEGRRSAREAALFCAAAACGLAVVFLPLLALKWTAVSALARGGFFPALAAVPGGGSLFSSGSLGRQFSLLWDRALAGNYVLAAALVLGAAGAAAKKNGAERGPAVPGAAALACVSLLLFFLLADPHNDFTYAAVCFAVLAAAAYGWRVPALRRSFPALAAAAAAFALAPAITPSGGARDVYGEEARFLAGRLGPSDTLFCAGPPDWRLAYLLDGKMRLLQADLGGNEGNAFSPELARPGPELLERLRTAASGKGRVLLAADAMFRPDGMWGREEAAARVTGAAEWVKLGFRLGEPEISPNGQHYYPLLPK